MPFSPMETQSAGGTVADATSAPADEEQPIPTEIQKADPPCHAAVAPVDRMASSFRRGTPPAGRHRTRACTWLPLAIARRTAGVLQNLPSTAVEVHGMGIFEKIFEIGTWCINDPRGV